MENSSGTSIHESMTMAVCALDVGNRFLANKHIREVAEFVRVGIASTEDPELRMKALETTNDFISVADSTVDGPMDQARKSFENVSTYFKLFVLLPWLEKNFGKKG